MQNQFLFIFQMCNSSNYALEERTCACLSFDSILLFFRHYFLTMPRSNKKKKRTYQPAVPTDDHAVAQLLGKEKTIMITRAIVSVYSVYFNYSYILFVGKGTKTRHQFETWYHKSW